MANRVHLLLHTDSIKLSHVRTFQSAAKTVERDYKKRYPKDTVKRSQVNSGRDIVKAIKAESDGSICSLDIFSHGNQGGVHIARKLKKPVPSGFLRKHAHHVMRRQGDRPQTMADAEYMEESMHGLYTDRLAVLTVSAYFNQMFEKSTDYATLSSVPSKKFAADAFVEFHGCRIAEVIPKLNTKLRSNFAEQFSQNLGSGAVVVGHITSSAPNRHPVNEGRRSDYRYGKVRVYKDGKTEGAVKRWGLKIPNSSTP